MPWAFNHSLEFFPRKTWSRQERGGAGAGTEPAGVVQAQEKECPQPLRWSRLIIDTHTRVYLHAYTHTPTYMHANIQTYLNEILEYILFSNLFSLNIT